MYIDTHCHLDDEKFINVSKIIEESLENDVNILIMSGYDINSSNNAVDFSKKYNEIYATVGIHPSEANEFKKENLIDLEELLLNEKVVAIGEIGLDYHYENVDKKKQKELFIEQIKIANKYKKPIVIHSRDAISDTYNIIEKYKDKDLKFVLHCYGSNYTEALKFIKLNGYFGIGGVVTFKNSKILKEVVEKISLDHFVLETDAPYLSPEPHRGELNSPAKIPLIAEKIAEIKQDTISNVRDMTTTNAMSLFDLKQ